MDIPDESRFASAPQTPEQFEGRVKKILLSGTFKKMVDAVGRYTEAEGREAGMAVYGYSGKVEVGYHLPDDDPTDALNYIDPDMKIDRTAKYTSYADTEGLFTNSDGKPYKELILDAHSHPVHDTAYEVKGHPMDTFYPSSLDLDTWSEQAQWPAGDQSTHPRLMGGILVRDGDFNKMLLIKRSEKRPWVPRYLQYERSGRGANFMHRVLESSGLVVATVDFNLDTQAYRQQAERIAAVMAETA